MSGDVAGYLTENIANLNACTLNLRTLEMGYEIAASHPNDWKSIFSRTLPWLDHHLQEGATTPLAELLADTKNVSSQIREYCKRTGKSRRSFFYWKKNLMKGLKNDVSL